MLTCGLVLLTLFHAAPTVQTTRPLSHYADSSARTIMAVSRSEPPGATSNWIQRILRQDGKTFPDKKLREIADSLAARAIRSGSTAETPVDVYARASASIMVLALSGAEHGGGRPFKGALDALIKVHRNAHSALGRGRVLDAMLLVADRKRALAYVKSVASSARDSTNWMAVNSLVRAGMRTGAPEREHAERALRELFESGSVRGERAKIGVAAYAASKGWKRGGK